MDMSINFLLQATRVLNFGNYDEVELSMTYNYITALNNEILNDYFNTCTILSYDNDLELYIEIVETLILIFEEKEEYEKCTKLKRKKEESIKIINTNKIYYGHNFSLVFFIFIGYHRLRGYNDCRLYH